MRFFMFTFTNNTGNLKKNVTNKAMKKGKLIVIEGGDGAGKGTQIKMILEKYPNIVSTREPGGTVFAEKIRSLALDDCDAKQSDGKTQFSLMWASRADHVKNLIVPSLEEGEIIICDRFDSSTFAYNVVAQDCPELEDLFWETRKTFIGGNTPDLYIYLDVDPEIGTERQKNDDVEINHYDEKPKEFKDKMRDGMLRFFKNYTIPNVIIDASRTPEEIFADIDVELSKIISQ